MSLALAALLGVALDRALGEPRRWHPLAGFGRYALGVERALRAVAVSALGQRLSGVLAVLAAVSPFVVLAALAHGLPYGLVVDAVLLYFALGWRSLGEHARAVGAALANDDLAEARRRVGFMVSRDTAAMQAGEVSKATVESVLENGNDAVFGALFWFAVAGAPGAVAYRLVNTLDAMWGYKNARYRHFGWAAARLDDAMNFIPARLTALSYAVFATISVPSPQPLMKPLPFGISRLRERGFTRALACWRRQAPAWDSPNAGPVMAAGAGALGLALGGEACYEGVVTERPPLGEGAPAGAADIERALRLVRHGVLLWLALMLLWEGLRHA
ncbi:MAG: cobalamin biosynthesis protein CobD [Betaproteobacteria bacterium]|nr:cobalamin biosynthesis protein CobD [Betaproteobacteria bacterium]